MQLLRISKLLFSDTDDQKHTAFKGICNKILLSYFWTPLSRIRNFLGIDELVVQCNFDFCDIDRSYCTAISHVVDRVLNIAVFRLRERYLWLGCERMGENRGMSASLPSFQWPGIKNHIQKKKNLVINAQKTTILKKVSKIKPVFLENTNWTLPVINFSPASPHTPPPLRQSLVARACAIFNNRKDLTMNHQLETSCLAASLIATHASPSHTISIHGKFNYRFSSGKFRW